jgi:branched-chain amino acid transport system substrate-binding protein
VAWLALFALALSACARTVAPPPPQPQATKPAPQPPVVTAPAPPPAAAPAVPAGKTPVALLLPLSGPNAALGTAMLDAAQMALYDVADETLELLPQDTQGTPQGAATAAQAALAAGAKLIIGPLIAAEVEAVKPIAHAAGVPVLAFSTSAQLAGDGTYLLGFLPRQEIERVTAYAHGKGAAHFAVLAPKTPYGEIAVEALRGAVAAQGASLERIDFYDASVPDPTPAVKAFAAAAQSADAVLLPEGGAQLKAIAPLLAYYNIDPAKVHFLGTGLWDEPGLGTETALDGGWYAAPPPAARADFEKRFHALYHQAPPRLTTLAYDATALAAVLAHGASGPDFSTAALTNPGGFSGIDGIFRLLPDGLVQRGLAVLEVHRDGNTVIDPAPQTFQASTN